MTGENTTTEAGDPTRAGAATDDMMERLRRLAVVADTDKRALPCYPHIEDPAREDVVAAAAACKAVKGYLGAKDETGRDLGCRFQLDRAFCARERVTGTYRDAELRLQSAGVPVLYANRVLEGVPGSPALPIGAQAPAPFEETDALRLTRAFVSQRPAGIELADGERVALVGNEWVIVMSGLPGCGKSLAAAYAIARHGGVWLAARTLSSPKTDLDEALRTSLLVIDDLGTEWAGESRYAVDRAASVLEERYANRRRTVVTTNLRRRCRKVETTTTDQPEEPPQFVERYGARIDDRLRERGRFVVFTNASLRGRV